MKDSKKYSFRQYSKKYKQFFNKEKNKLEKILPNANIEHVGSSAVIGLGGKGIIDIAISVPREEVKNAIKKLQINKFDYKGGSEERNFFQKIIKYHGNERRVHIQLTQNNSKVWKSMLAVRDYLNKNKKSLKEYARIKIKAVEYAKGEGEKYRKYKKSFLQKIEKLALNKLN